MFYVISVLVILFKEKLELISYVLSLSLLQVLHLPYTLYITTDRARFKQFGSELWNGCLENWMVQRIEVRLYSAFLHFKTCIRVLYVNLNLHLSVLWGGQCISLEVEEVLHKEKSKYQEILVLQT